MKEERTLEKAVSKFIDKLFSLEKHSITLISIFVLGFILRLVATINLSVSADMMHFVTHAINFLSSGRLITYDQSAGLWFAFTSVIYKIFGTTQFAAGFASLLFGSFSILVIYLLSKEFFNEKISLLAAFLIAISPFSIKSTVAEMDIMAMFFVLLGMLLFVKATKSSDNSRYLMSGMFMGLAIYTKVYPLLFIPSLLLYFIYINYKNKSAIFSKENIKKMLVFLGIIFIFSMPALTHNYLLYQDRGFLDLQFTRTLGLGKNISEQYYGWDHQFNAKNDWKGLFLGNSLNSGSKYPSLLTALGYLTFGDPMIFILGVIGLIYTFSLRKFEKRYAIFYLLSIMFITPFLASIILLSKHYLFLSLLFAPIASLGLDELSKKISELTKTNLNKPIILIVLITSLIILGFPTTAGEKDFYGNNHISEAIKFKDKNIPENALIVMDSRIYSGRINWISQGRAYLDGNQFVQIANSYDSLPGATLQTEVYYFECAKDDCGWGTVKNSPDLNSSMESLTAYFKNSGTLEKTIKERNIDKPYIPILINNQKNDIINIYRLTIPLKSSVLQLAAQPKPWFLYTIGYEPVRSQFDYYNTDGIINSSLDKLAHWIVYITLIISMLSPIYVIYLINKK